MMAVHNCETALEEALEAAYQVPESEEARQQFRVNDLGGAGWAVRKLARIEEKRREARAVAAREVVRIQDWLKGEEARVDRDGSFFTGLLADYHARILQADPKAKTIKLPCGTLKMRAQEPDFKRDETLLLPWVKQDPERAAAFLRVKEEVAWSELKGRLEIIPPEKTSDGRPWVIERETGDILPGVTVELKPPKFSVDLGKEDER